MKKRILSIIVVLAVIVASLTLFVGCEKRLNDDEAFDILKQATAKSIEYQIFYWKELQSQGPKVKENTITQVNSVCSLDKKNDYKQNADGTYADHYISIFNSYNGELRKDIIVGLSKDGKKDPGKNVAFMTNYTGVDDKNKAQYSKEYQEISITDFQNQEFYNQFTLKEKLKEISDLQREDIVFDAKAGALKTFDLIKYKFKVTDEYLQKYQQANGVESVLKGKYVTMEVVFDRVGNLVVAQEDVGTESFLGAAEYESYKLEIVYLGPKIKTPNYNEKSEDKLVWQQSDAIDFGKTV